MRDFRSLLVWRKSHELTLKVYRVTKSFPADERFGLTSQLRRSCSSVPANIAEGCGRASEADFGRFLTLAAGSASETEYHLLLATDLGYLQQPDSELLQADTTEVKRMLSGLLGSLQKK